MYMGNFVFRSFLTTLISFAMCSWSSRHLSGRARVDLRLIFHHPVHSFISNVKGDSILPFHLWYKSRNCPFISSFTTRFISSDSIFRKKDDGKVVPLLVVTPYYEELRQSRGYIEGYVNKILIFSFKIFHSSPIFIWCFKYTGHEINIFSLCSIWHPLINYSIWCTQTQNSFNCGGATRRILNPGSSGS